MLRKKNLKKGSKPSRSVTRSIRSTQGLIPVERAFANGIFIDAAGNYSRTYSFTDINYSELQDNEKEQRLSDYSIILNSLDKGIRVKISIFYRPNDPQQFQKNILIPPKEDGLEGPRDLMNKVLQARAQENAGMQKQCYLTVTDQRRNMEEAVEFFNRVEGQLISGFESLGVQIQALSLSERLRLLHDVYRPGLEHTYRYSIDEEKRVGQSFKDAIAPLDVDGLNSGKYLNISGRFCRTLFLNMYPTYLSDRMLSDLSSINKPLIISIDFLPLPNEEAMSIAESRADAAELRIVSFNLKQQRNENYSGRVPYRYTENAKRATELLQAIRERDQNLFLTTVTIAHFADTLGDLNADTDELIGKGEGFSCQFLPLTFQHLHGLNTVLPYGVPHITADRLLTTQALAGLCPFTAQEVLHPGGVWFGNNAKTKRMIVVNRSLLVNGNGMVLATTGGGKSFFIKEEALQVILRDMADVIFLDPEKEYAKLAEHLGGSVITLSPSTNNRINPLALDREEKINSEAVRDKIDFILSFCQTLLAEDGQGVDSLLKTVIDRCARQIYAPFLSGQTSELPTLVDLRNALVDQPEPEAQMLALRMGIYTDGSFDMFARQTNVSTDAKVIDYDLSELGTHMQDVGMLVVLESVYTRLMENWKKGRETYIFIDEMMTFFRHKYSAEYFAKLWSRCRKRGGFIIGATQNVTTVFSHPEASILSQNSDVTVMLYQSELDRAVLTEHYSLSETQRAAIGHARPGCGLIRVGGTLVSFENEFPDDNPLYKLLTTKPGDGWGGDLSEN